VSERRKFTLLHMMIVVAAVAVSLWLRPDDLLPGFERAIEELIRRGSFRLLAYSTRLMLNGDPKLFGLFSIQPMVAVWTLALLLLELLHFRPPLRRLARQPGFAACCAVALVIVLVGSMNFAMLEHRPTPSTPMSIKVHHYLELTLTFSHGQCGAAVASAWLTLALTGRWRPRPDWLDRAGRALGIFWIALIPLVWLDAYLFS
jgi:hypothetical protein